MSERSGFRKIPDIAGRSFTLPEDGYEFKINLTQCASEFALWQ
jgi:hypothetical protein